MNLLTRRLPTLLGLLLLVGVGGGMWWWIQSTRPVILEGASPQKVRVTNVADNKFSVSWITQIPTTGQVEYGEMGEKLAQTAHDDRGAKIDLHLVHHVTIAGLQPNTQYKFRIISGESGAKFDNNGSPYSIITGKVVGGTPTATSLYGSVELAGIDGAVVYLALPNGEPASVLITNSGNYSIPLATIRSSDGKGYVKYDAGKTIASVSVEDGDKSAVATVSMNSVTPIPLITMGQTHDFRANIVTEPKIAQVEPGSTPEPISIFNVEPLGSGGESGSEITILNPSVDGEELATTLPELRGLAPIGKTLSITLHAGVVYTDTVVVGIDGTWEWTPPEELTNGQHDITVSYVDSEGIEQKTEKSFFVSTALASGGDPAFESTPSAGTYASPTPRITTPSTESGVPVSGIMDHTLLTGAVGIVIMVLGVMILAI